MSFINYEKNANLHYELIPSRIDTEETIILAHGVGLSSKVWDWIIPYLTDEFNIVLFDFRGHGLSNLNIDDLKWELLINDFIILLRDLKLENYHFVGHGLGAHFGVEYFSKYSHSAKSLVILSTPFYYPFEIKSKVFEYNTNVIKESKSFFITMIMNSICYPLTREKQEFLQMIYSEFNLDTYHTFVSLYFNSLSLERLKQIHIPTLILMGENDPLNPPQLNSLSLSFLEKGRGYIISKCSNLLHIDQPEETAKRITSFIYDVNNATEEFSSPKPSEELIHWLQNLLNSGQEVINSLNTLKVSVENGFSIKYNAKEILGLWNQRKAKEIMVFLAFHNGKTTREHLIHSFWQDKPLSSAQNNLRVSMNHIKRIIESNQLQFDDIFTINKNYIFLKCKISFSTLDFVNLMNKIIHEPNLNYKNQLNLQLLKTDVGDLFAGFDENWFIKIKNELEENCLEIQRSLLLKNIEAGNIDHAILNLKRFIKLNDSEEEAIKDLIQLIKQQNDEKNITFWKKELQSLSKR